MIYNCLNAFKSLLERGKGKWKIIGGWVLQPDCLMPSGESFVRQMLYGRAYFREKFGVEPETAINVDSFGHAQGLVQIMQQADHKWQRERR